MREQRGPLIAGVAGVVVVILLIVVMLLPRVSKIHEAKDQLAQAQQQEQALQTQLTSLKATADKAKSIRTELNLLDAAVPQEVELSDLIRMLNDTADQAGVDFMSVVPGSPTAIAGGTIGSSGSVGSTGSTGTTETPSPSPSESAAPTLPAQTGPTLPQSISLVPVVIIVEGSYFAIDEYLFRLESLPRISKVSQIGLALGGNGYPQLQMTLTVNFYTTDVSAGPGSQAGSQTGGALGSGSVPSQPGATPTPTGTQGG